MSNSKDGTVPVSPRLNFHAEREQAGHPKTTFFLQSWVSTIQTVVLTADVFQFCIMRQGRDSEATEAVFCL